MGKINVAVVGWGNVGKCAGQAVLAAPDMALAGIACPELGGASPPELAGVNVADSVRQLGKVDAALLCVPTRSVRALALELLSMSVNTVDCFDIHKDIAGLRAELSPVAREHSAVAVVSAGWDPGSDSVVRALMEAMAPKGITVTNFGPGMSMGHSVAAKAVDGVSDALSMTIPTGAGVHRRVVYISLAPGADFEKCASAIKRDPYFSSDDTVVLQADCVSDLLDCGHGVNMSRKGVSGATHNQMFEFTMKINNPALTAQVMTACARAAARQRPGAYTMIELPVIDLLYGEREALIRRLV